MTLLGSLLLVSVIGLAVGQGVVILVKRADMMTMFTRANILQMLKLGISITKLAKSLSVPRANQIEKLIKASNFDKIAKMFQKQGFDKLFTPSNLLNLMTNGINYMELAKMLKIPGAEQMDSMMKGFGNSNASPPEDIGKIAESLKAKLEEKKAVKSQSKSN